MIIHFDINEQMIHRKQKKHLVNYSKNYLYLSFNFNESWDDLTKFIIFKNSTNNYFYELEYDSTSKQYITIVPSIVLQEDKFKFTVYGIKIVDDKEVRITTEDTTIKLHPTGFTTPVTEVPEEDTNVDIFTTIKEELNEIDIRLNGKVDKETGKILSTNDFNDNCKTKLMNIEDGATRVIIDNELSNVSENPVQNKLINNALENKEDVFDFVERLDITIQNLIGRE